MNGHTLVSLCIFPMLLFLPVNSFVWAENRGGIPPVYVTVAGHIEDTEVYALCETYPDFRARLLRFAQMLSETGAAFNLQIDYEFLAGTARCETEAMRAVTDGKNVIEYLASHYGYEIDAHQEGGTEEGQDNYADVRYLGGILSPRMSENVGGLLWDDPNQFARLANGESGLLYPDFTWFPEVLTMAVSRKHHYGDFSDDDVASGIWRPKGANANFWMHDAQERMVYVGPGEHTDWGRKDPYFSAAGFVKHLVEALDAGAIPSNRIYTVTLAVPQSVIFDALEHPRLKDKIAELEKYILSGRAKYVTYSQAVEIWKTVFDEKPNIYKRAAPTPAGPVPDIQANGSNGPITLSQGAPVSITIALDPKDYAGASADWWIAAQTPSLSPFGWWSYAYPAGWLQGLHRCIEAGLVEFPSLKVLDSAVLPSGKYVFYFGVDAPDGDPKGPWLGLDSVEVIVE